MASTNPFLELEVSECIFIRFFALQVIEKLIRLERLVDQAPLFSPNAPDPDVVAVFKRVIGAIRDNIRLAMIGAGEFGVATDDAGKVMCIERPQSSDAASARAKKPALGLLVKSIDGINYLHARLSYVTGQFGTPETRAFLTGLAKHNVDLLAGQESFSVILSDRYMFEETDLVSHLRPDPLRRQGNDSPTLFLPKIEAHNPLAWGTLVHEVGHTLASSITLTEEEISTIVRPHSLNGKENLASWVTEVFCDFVSLRLLGPAYLAAFIEFACLRGSLANLDDASDSHPPPLARVVWMFEALEKAAVVAGFRDRLWYWTDLARFYYAMFESRSTVQRQYVGAKVRDWTSFGIWEGRFRDLVERKVESWLPGINEFRPPFEAEKFSHLSERLEKQIPIGSLSRTIIDGTTSLANPADLDELARQMKHVREVPNTVAEIVNAGWLYKCEHIYRALVPKVHKLSDEDLRWFSDSLMSLDEILRSSVETSYMHGLLI